MSRQGRMLLVLAIFGVAGVAALGMMAHRYGSILERRQEAQQISERRVAAPDDSRRSPGTQSGSPTVTRSRPASPGGPDPATGAPTLLVVGLRVGKGLERLGLGLLPKLPLVLRRHAYLLPGEGEGGRMNDWMDGYSLRWMVGWDGRLIGYNTGYRRRAR